MKYKIKRRLANLIINPKFQIKFILFATIGGLLISILDVFVFYSYIKVNYNVLVDSSPELSAHSNVYYTDLFNFSRGIVIFTFAYMILIIGTLSVYFTHRIAGPMFNFKRVFNEIKSGKTDSRVKLRKNDYFRDLAQSFNEMMEELTKK